MRPFGRLIRAGTAVCAAGLLVFSATPAGAAAGPAAAPAAVVPAAAPAAPPAPPRPAVGSPADLVLTGQGAIDGYHLYLARAADGWAWEPAAVLDPGGDDSQQWIGNSCLTGDGSTAVAVVAPWSAANSDAGIEQGATAYAVDLATDQVRVLADGVSLAYFDPGCGAGRQVALTTYVGSGEQTTRVESVDAGTGAVAATVTLPGEYTSAVPVGGAIDAAHGSALVRFTAGGAQLLGTVPGQAYGLKPAAQGGLDLLSADSAGSASAWSFTGRLTELATGKPSGLQLGGAPGGASVLTGSGLRTAAAAKGAAAASPGTAGPAAAPPAALSLRQDPKGQVLGVSRLGAVSLVAPAKSAADAAALLPAIVAANGATVRAAAKPATAEPVTTTATAVGAVDTAAGGVAQAAATGNSPAGNAVGGDTAKPASSPGPQTPACAVPRDDPALQVPQPTNEQIDWAIQAAVDNALPSRRSGFDGLPGGGYSPEKDFPQPALDGAPAGTHVPALVVAAVLAQESNFNQASWHAPAGTAGDPLVADYYGDGGSSGSIDYADADCGYGLGQITDIMNAGNPIGQTVQDRVAVDYAENVASVVQHLAEDWNTLYSYSTPITVNGANPAYLEDWYDVLWTTTRASSRRTAATACPPAAPPRAPPAPTAPATGAWAGPTIRSTRCSSPTARSSSKTPTPMRPLPASGPTRSGSSAG